MICESVYEDNKQKFLAEHLIWVNKSNVYYWLGLPTY